MPLFPTAITGGGGGGGGGTVTSVGLSVPSFLSVSGSPVTTSGVITVGYSGTALPVSSGGTGFTSYGSGELLYGNGSGTLNTLPFIGLPGYVLAAGAGAPEWVSYSTISVTTLTGTANQVLVNGTSGSAQTGNITLTTPQNIHTGATPRFAALALNTTPTGAGYLIDTASSGTTANIFSARGEDFMALLQRQASSINLSGASFRMDKARGTLASPSAVQVTDTLGAVSWFGYVNGTYSEAASIQAPVTGAVSGSTMPVSIDFYVRNTTSTMRRGRLWHDGGLELVNAGSSPLVNYTQPTGGFLTIPTTGDGYAVLYDHTSTGEVRHAAYSTVGTAFFTFYTTAGGTKTQNLRIDGNGLTTAAPSGSTARPVKFGDYTADGSIPDTTGYVIVEVNGVNRKFAIIS